MQSHCSSKSLSIQVTSQRLPPPGPPLDMSAHLSSPPGPQSESVPSIPLFPVTQHRLPLPGPSLSDTAHYSSVPGQSIHIKEKEKFNTIEHDHPYALMDSPRRLKKRLEESVEHLEEMRRKVYLTTKKNYKLKRKVDNLDAIVKSLKDGKMISSDVAETIEKSFSGVPKEVWARGQKKRGTTAVFPEELKSFALTVQFYSNKAYKYLRESFDLLLPHPRQLRRWYSVIEGN